jgi:hypothetical protein
VSVIGNEVVTTEVLVKRQRKIGSRGLRPDIVNIASRSRAVLDSCGRNI